MKRNSPWALTAEMMFAPNRALVLETTGVLPRLP